MSISARTVAILPTVPPVRLTGCASILDGLERKDANDGRWPWTERTYVGPCAATSSRRYPDTAILDMPRFWQVVILDLIDDQRAWAVGDALHSIVGIQVTGRR